MSSRRYSWRARAALASALLVPMVGAGCGSGSSTTALPTAPGNSAGGGGLSQQVGTMNRGPYLQHADAGVAVVWYTESPTEGRLRWEMDENATGEAASLAGVSTRHEAVISPLVPGARYTYGVYSAGGLLAGAGAATQFTFRAPEPEVVRMVVFGDSGQGGAGQYAVARAIGAEAAPLDLVMIVGDVVYPPADDASWDPRFFAPYRALLPATPFYAAPGNHDYEVQAGSSFYDVFTLPRNGPPGLNPESSYWLERAGVQMIVHDTNQTILRLRELSVPWHAETARRPADFRLVFQHHTMYSSGPNYAQFPAGSLRALLAPLYTATGVDVVFNGHDHLYERTRPIDGVVYVTTGAGGAELYERQHTNTFTLAFANDRHSYTHVEVRGRTLLLRQMDTEGHGIDALSISKPVVASDALRVFPGTGTPPREWETPGFDDSRWAEAARTGRPAAVCARRSFELVRPEEVGEAVLRVHGARDFVVSLNGIPVARGGGGDETGAAYPVPPTLLRTGANVLSLEGQVEGDEAIAPSMELSLFASPAR